MVDILILVGIVCLALALWKGRTQSARERTEFQELMRVRADLLEAKKEVGSLLEQLEVVSERVVEEISAKVNEIRCSPQKHDTKERELLESQGGPEKIENNIADEPEEFGEEDFGEYLEEDLPEYTGNEPGDFVEHEDDTTDWEGNETVVARNPRNHNIMGATARPDSSGGPVQYAKPVDAKRMRGKTIIFPGRKEDSNETRPATFRNEPAPELSPKHQMVYAMAKLGYPEEEIAKQMKIGKGEVRLMLQLKRKGEEVNA